MRGALVIVSPPAVMVDRIQKLADLLDCVTIEMDADDISGPVDLTVDPLGEVRVDGVSITDSPLTEERPS